jgi:hypothetical protein
VDRIQSVSSCRAQCAHHEDEIRDVEGKHGVNEALQARKKIQPEVSRRWGSWQKPC